MHAAQRLPYDTRVKVDEKEIQRSAISELKETKTAYKEARRNAGKSSAPKVIAFLVALILVGAGSAVATWYFVNENAKAEKAALQEQIDATKADAEAARAESDAARKELAEARERLAKYEKALAEEAVVNAESREAKQTGKADSAENDAAEKTDSTESSEKNSERS